MSPYRRRSSCWFWFLLELSGTRCPDCVERPFKVLKDLDMSPSNIERHAMLAGWDESWDEMYKPKAKEERPHATHGAQTRC